MDFLFYTSSCKVNALSFFFFHFVFFFLLTLFPPLRVAVATVLVLCVRVSRRIYLSSFLFLRQRHSVSLEVDGKLRKLRAK